MAKKIKEEKAVQVIETNNFELSAEIVAGSLTSNAKELRAKIENELKNYQVEKYLDNPDAAKTDKALLNKVEKAVSDKRKEITKKWNEPLDLFLSEMKGLEKSISDASSKLKSITDEVAEKEKASKRKEIEDYWSTLDYKIVSLDRIFNPQWLNKTFTMKNVMLECENAIEKITSDLEAIKKACEEQDKEIGQAYYLECLDLNSTLNKIAQLKENRIKVKEIEAAKIEKPVEKPVETKEDDPIMEYTLKFKAKRSKLLLLRKFIVDNNIEYIKL